MKSPFTRRPIRPERGTADSPPSPTPVLGRGRPPRQPALDSAPPSPVGEGGAPILVLGDGRRASLTPGSTHQVGRPSVDICFVFDTTGSMSDKITGLVRAMSDLVAQLASMGLDWRVTTVPFGDLTVPGDRIDDDLGFVNTRAAAQAQLRSMPHFHGGGNGGESSIEAMLVGVRRPCRPAAVKIIVLLTDEPALTNPEIRPDFVAAELRHLDAVCFVVSPDLDYFKRWAFDNGGRSVHIGRSMDTTALLALLRRLVSDVAVVAEQVHRLAGGSVSTYRALTAGDRPER